MTAVRRSLGLVAVAASLAACGAAGIALAPGPALDPLGRDRMTSTVFLIGDAGEVPAGGSPVLAELVRQARGAPRTSAIVFLGDNVYPAGIPPEADPRYEEMTRRLYAQAAMADSTGLPVYLVPGNHDWARHGEDGWAAVQRSGALLDRYARERGVRVAQLPRGGCPGPELVTVGERIRLVLIDTQWWLHSRSRPGRFDDATRRALPDPDPGCAVTTEAGLADTLRGLFHGPGDRIDVLIGHHPLLSHGEHGGFHPWIQYVLPLVPTPIAPWLWLPIGWIYPVGRRLVADRQDQASGVYRAMRRSIEASFAPGRPLVYASGHEHALEVLRWGADRFYLVSGAGLVEHETTVRRSDSTAYSSSDPGFMRLDLFPADSVRLGVTSVSDAGVASEVYRAWLKR